MLNWRVSVRKNKERTVLTVLAYLLVLRKMWENMHTAMEDKQQLIASN